MPCRRLLPLFLMLTGMSGLHAPPCLAEEAPIRDILGLEVDSSLPQSIRQALQPGLNKGYIDDLVGSLGKQQRDLLLADAEAFRELVRKEAQKQSVLQSALHNRLDRNRDVQFLVRRSAENILREYYLRLLIASRIPEAYPSAEQLSEFYSKNKELLAIGERIQLWQIFLPLAEEASADVVARVTARVDGLVQALREGKIDFATAAVQHSEHVPSRANGGYMGLLPVADLIPEIRDVALALEEGSVSPPVRTPEGLHILRRGTVTEPFQLSLEAGYDTVRNAMLNQAVEQLTRAVYQQAEKSYPVTLSDRQIEEWRLQLKIVDPGGTSGAPPLSTE